MIIIGHENVPFQPFFWIKTVDDINLAPEKSPIIFKQNSAKFKELVLACSKKNREFANEVFSINEALIANANRATFLVVNSLELAKGLQKIAEDYLFDAKILLRITKEKDLEKIAQKGIDGVVFPQGEINGES
ncbi:MAG: hypothetical protein ACK5LP_07230 [Campylobacteraceae bacterium]